MSIHIQSVYPLRVTEGRGSDGSRVVSVLIQEPGAEGPTDVRFEDDVQGVGAGRDGHGAGKWQGDGNG